MKWTGAECRTLVPEIPGLILSQCAFCCGLVQVTFLSFDLHLAAEDLKIQDLNLFCFLVTSINQFLMILGRCTLYTPVCLQDEPQGFFSPFWEFFGTDEIGEKSAIFRQIGKKLALFLAKLGTFQNCILY